jgi:hypothetical protein
MSGGEACKCGERKKPLHERRWRVLQRKYAYSAFNGYRYTPSDYSCVHCRECGRKWRTKAAYVDDLRDGKDTDRMWLGT